jgi:hypothetical protein
MEGNNQSKMVTITGLWLKKNSMQGRMGNARVVIYRNNHKKSDKHPDYYLAIAPVEKQDEQGQPQVQASPQFDDDVPPF